jgi:hypothetical protein
VSSAAVDSLEAELRTGYMLVLSAGVNKPRVVSGTHLGLDTIPDHTRLLALCRMRIDSADFGRIVLADGAGPGSGCSESRPKPRCCRLLTQ